MGRLAALAEIQGADGVWLYDWTVDGRVFRFATRPSAVTDAAGVVHQYAGGLSDFSLSLIVPGEISIPLTIGAGIDWATLVARGIALERSQGTLRRWYQGQTLEQARTVLTGLVVAVEYGSPSEAITLSLERRPTRLALSAPSEDAKVDASSWPVTALSEAVEQSQGAYYPLIIGAPGTGSGATPSAVLPLVWAEYENAGGTGLDWVVVADGPIEATAIREFHYSDAGTTETTIAIATRADSLGRLTSGFEWGATVAVRGDKYYAGFLADGGAVFGGGIVWRGSLLRGAGDVIRWTLETYAPSIRVDVGRMEAHRARLNAYLIDAVINRPTNMWTWLTREILPLLPVRERHSSDGLWYEYIGSRASTTDSVALLDADAGRVVRESSIRWTGADSIANEITLEYGPDRPTGRYRSRATITADYQRRSTTLPGQTDSTVLGSLMCRVSQQTYGVRPLSLRSDVIWETATAHLILEQIAAARALPRRTVVYSGPESLGYLDLGDTVTLTDADVQLSAALARVDDIVVRPGSVLLSLTLMDDHVQSARLTS